MANTTALSALKFDGKIALVTGTTNGLGRAVSIEIVKRNVNTLIMGVRNVQQGEILKTELLALNPDVTIHVVSLQMDDFDSVIKFADQVAALTQLLDLSILNAGVGGYEYNTSKSGHEGIMQVNVYSTALLALKLLPLLENTARAKGTPSRLTWVGSFVQMDHSMTKKPLSTKASIIKQLDDEKNFNKSRYQDSKLMGTMFVQRLALKVNNDLVVFNEVSPGPVLTNFGSTYPAYFRIGIAIIGHFVNKEKSLAEGTNKYLHAAGLAGKESHGEYVSDYKVAP
jgi:NAD(P)-dependent dehydrogenase (short-subunit alcohol dehydrogenase family)